MMRLRLRLALSDMLKLNHRPGVLITSCARRRRTWIVTPLTGKYSMQCATAWPWQSKCCAS
eukprot:4981009-Lingulodinium_polyedra.AAC.1